MRWTNTKRVGTMLVVLLIALVSLAGCGDDAEPTSTPTVDAASVAASDLPATSPTESASTVESPLPEAAIALTATALTATETSVAVEPVATATQSPGVEEASTGCAIEPNPDLIGYDDVVGKLGCPIADATIDSVGINEFGEGPDYSRFMLWFGGEGQIYVLSADGRWLAYTDTWQETDPEISCNPENIDPETSPPLPRRGFGKLWCTVDTVRTSMGYIDREERLCQHAVVQRFQKGRLLACFEDATIRYFRILEDGAWDMELVQ